MDIGVSSLGLSNMDTLPLREVPWAVVFLLTAVVLYRLMRRDGPSLDHIPILRAELGNSDKRRVEYSKHALSMLQEGYRKVYSPLFMFMESLMNPKLITR